MKIWKYLLGGCMTSGHLRAKRVGPVQSLPSGDFATFACPRCGGNLHTRKLYPRKPRAAAQAQ